MCLTLHNCSISTMTVMELVNHQDGLLLLTASLLFCTILWLQLVITNLIGTFTCGLSLASSLLIPCCSPFFVSWWSVHTLAAGFCTCFCLIMLVLS